MHILCSSPAQAMTSLLDGAKQKAQGQYEAACFMASQCSENCDKIKSKLLHLVLELRADNNPNLR